MAGDFERACVCWMPLGSDIIVLHDTCGVEVVHERLAGSVQLGGRVRRAVPDYRRVEILVRVEVLVDIPDLLHKELTGLVSVAFLSEAAPERLRALC